MEQPRQEAVREGEPIRKCFESSSLVFPSADDLNFVDLVRALAFPEGAPLRDDGPGVAKLRGLLGESRHCLLILVDGLGAGLLESLPPGSFLRTGLVQTIRSVFPSTTASALTTLATARWPCEHCIPGWWTRLPDRGISAVSLLFEERSTGRRLGDLGIAAQSLYPVPSIWPGVKRRFRALLPAEISESVYARYLSGGMPRVGYRDLADAAEIARAIAAKDREPSFVYVYLPYLDALMHEIGTGDRRVAALLSQIDGELSTLAAAVSPSARVVVTGDHGQVDIDQDRILVLSDADPLCSHLLCQPTGEPSAPIFHLHPGHEHDFAAEFEARFGEVFALLSVAETERLRLYGPTDLDPRMRERLGAFVGIAQVPAKIYLGKAGNSVHHRGIHGGLRPAEMLVPLIVA